MIARGRRTRPAAIYILLALQVRAPRSLQAQLTLHSESVWCPHVIPGGNHMACVRMPMQVEQSRHVNQYRSFNGMRCINELERRWLCHMHDRGEGSRRLRLGRAMWMPCQVPYVSERQSRSRSRHPRSFLHASTLWRGSTNASARFQLDCQRRQPEKSQALLRRRYICIPTFRAWVPGLLQTLDLPTSGILRSSPGRGRQSQSTRHSRWSPVSCQRVLHVSCLPPVDSNMRCQA
jgi:hypothetical protein